MLWNREIDNHVVLFLLTSWPESIQFDQKSKSYISHFVTLKLSLLLYASFRSQPHDPYNINAINRLIPPPQHIGKEKDISNSVNCKNIIGTLKSVCYKPSPFTDQPRNESWHSNIIPSSHTVFNQKEIYCREEESCRMVLFCTSTCVYIVRPIFTCIREWSPECLGCRHERDMFACLSSERVLDNNKNDNIIYETGAAIANVCQRVEIQRRRMLCQCSTSLIL